MITETEVRQLVARAADTIEVPPASRAPDGPQPRRWAVPVVAAGAVAAAVVAGFTLIDRQHNDSVSPTPPVATRLPSVFGYDVDAAKRLLTRVGLEVAVKTEHGCQEVAGRAVRTEPEPGTKVVRGDRVTLVVSTTDPLDDCPSVMIDRARAWELLDYANGRGPSPRFAPNVHVTLNRSRSDLNTVLRALAVVAQRPYSGQFLAVGIGGSPKSCDPLPRGRRAPDLNPPTYAMSIVFPSNGFIDPVCNSTGVYLNRDGAIEQLNVIVPAFVTAPPEATIPPDPDGVGARFLAFAQGKSNNVPVDSPVKLYLGNVYQRTISAVEAADRSSYDLCSAYAGRSCPMSAIAELDGTPYRPVVTDELGTCVKQDGPRLKASSTGGSKHVQWGVGEPLTCAGDWVVELWYNDEGQITAVNLLLGSP